ncbi:MAG: hypothetical protein CVV64_11030 [Candidatus Wallbacteria bacterium HGW-Wallbacteria-1]|uniref:L,D-TPase catalytic domain-containing protein n=1 Tax=Candidatus Wallbacteria bacterium HGW-Wallbacteria-1 TaxID=2013854 RepID=A0A2N1PP41_9BACT|nr:MAG: hypothetical protein CVV64_11030 [Candidatus Wallbacteria bacterium HGW-Wallbacteria-1]
METPVSVFNKYVQCLTGESFREFQRVSAGKNNGSGVNESSSTAVLVDVSDQRLFFIGKDGTIACFPVSTSAFGTGSEAGSNKTPLGLHYICRKIGKSAKKGTIFASRANTGKVTRIYTDRTNVKTDYVLTRILRLRGVEKGLNSGKGVDSFDRFIYIHGTAEEGLIGTPASHGCIRMINDDVIDLFNRVEEGTPVLITR